MKTAISIPDPVFNEAEALAAEKGWSRSHLYSAAIADFVQRNRVANITERLNAVYADEDSELPADIDQLQNDIFPEDEW